MKITKTALTIIIAIIVIVMAITAAQAIEVTFAWDANSEKDLAGYRLYWGTAPRSYDRTVDVGNVTTYTLKDVFAEQTTYYFAVTAYDNDGNQSGYSKELSWAVPDLSTDTVPPVMPVFRIVDYRFTIEVRSGSAEAGPESTD